MTMTTSFWKTIKQIPDLATDTLDWRERLTDCWDEARRYLSKTSRFAEQIGCPSPGGEHCPRRVVRHPDGTIRAVCGDPARLCKTLTLQAKHIRIREIDRRKLVADIAAALAITPATDPRDGAGVFHLGDHAIGAGRGFPVFVSLSGWQSPLSAADILDLDRRDLPFVLLVASLHVVDTAAIPVIRGMRGRVLTYEECLRFASDKGLEPVAPPATLFAPEIDALADAGEGMTRPVMDLPVGASWGDLRYAFNSDDVLNVSYGKQPPKRIDPDILGMKDERNGKATRQWRLLRMCVLLDGNLPRSMPPRELKGRRLSGHMLTALKELERGYDRQRQLLAASLKARFGIDEDPFVVRDDCFEARFTVDASGLKQGRADQRERNFADDD